MQKSPLALVPSLSDSYIYTVRAALRIICIRAESHSARALKIDDLRLIWALFAAREGKLSQSEIAGVLGIGANAMVSMADLLEKKLKLVTRTKNATNRREQRLKLTIKGEKVVKTWQGIVDNTLKDIFHPLSQRDLDCLKEMCVKIIDDHHIRL